MPKLSTRAAALKRLRTKADALWQQIVKLAHPQCEVCGLPTRVGHHFFTTGSSSALRYDLENGIGLCNGCHLRVHNGQPEKIFAIRDGRGADWYDDLIWFKSMVAKRNRAYYEGEIQRLTERLQELEGSNP